MMPIRIYWHPMVVAFFCVALCTLLAVAGAYMLDSSLANWESVFAGAIWTCGCFGGFMSMAYHITWAYRLVNVKTVTDFKDISTIDRQEMEEICSWLTVAFDLKKRVEIAEALGWK
jgi:hypothetical protein